MSLGYISKKDLIKELQINRKTFKKWVDSEKLPIIRIGNKVYVRDEEFNDWLKQYSVNEPSLLDLKSIFT